MTLRLYKIRDDFLHEQITIVLSEGIFCLLGLNFVHKAIKRNQQNFERVFEESYQMI